MTEVDWADIGDLIDRWSKRNPEDFKDNMDLVAEAKAMTTNEFGEGETESLRMGVRIHANLLHYIERFHPNIFETKGNAKEFANRFPKFAVPERY